MNLESSVTAMYCAKRFITPPKTILRSCGRAIREFDMIRDGDRILLGLSGGKDSLSLLHTLGYLQQRAPVKFALGAVTVDPMTSSYDPSPLKDYLAQLGVDYHYRQQAIEARAKERMGKDSYCAFCARMRRGIMYDTARRAGYGVMALAQHLDDLAESFLMSALYGGTLNTMKAHYANDAGDLRIIRPLVYARERQLRDFAAAAKLPVIAENCPACFAAPTQRQRMKALLAEEEAHNNLIFRSLASTLRPLMSAGMSAIGTQRA